MRVLDGAGAEVASPDLEAGRLVADRVLVAHHEAVAEVPRETRREVAWQDPANAGNVLYRTVVVQERVPASDAWDEYEDVWRYVPYTEEEIAERKAAAEREAFLAEAPARVDDLDEAVAELGVLADANAVTLEDVLDAVAELGAIVAGD